MRRLKRFGQLSAIVVVGVSAVLAAHAQTRDFQSVGVALTGPNDRCGDQVWTLDRVPDGPLSRGTFLGIKDGSSGASDAIPLTFMDCLPEADPNRLVATHFDAAYGAVRGWVTPNAVLSNLSFRSIPVPAGNGVRAPIPFPGSVPPNPLPPTISEPIGPITLGTWLAADGELEVVCDDATGTATIAVGMRNLIPNGVYTMWGHWVDPGATPLQVPFGGLPNTIVADVEGNAELCREVAFCPLDLAPDASQLQYVSIAFHGDGVTYGAVPYEPFTTRAFVGLTNLPFLSTIPGGIVTFEHLGFRINAGGGPDPDPDDPGRFSACGSGAAGGGEPLLIDRRDPN